MCHSWEGATGFSLQQEVFMRKCVVLLVAALAVLSFTLPTPNSAQSVYIGAGGPFPTGDFKDVD